MSQATAGRGEGAWGVNPEEIGGSQGDFDQDDDDDDTPKVQAFW